MGSVARATHDDTEDMKKVLMFLKLAGEMNKLTLSKGVSMKDVKEKAGEVQGFNYVLTGIARENQECKKTVGDTPAQRALVQQWLQQGVFLYGKGPIKETDVLKEIDAALSSTTFLAGHSMSLADPVMFLALYSTILEMNFYEKEKLPHLSRWFHLMQTNEELRKGQKPIVISKNRLYNSISAHP